MAVLRSVSKTDTFEKQRQIINLLGQDLYDYVAGGQGISIFTGEFGDGTKNAPSLTFASDVSLGFYKEGNGKLGIAASSNHLVSFNATGSYFVRNFYGEKRAIGTISITTPGSNYAEGVYNDVTLLGGSGLSSTANITVNNAGEVSDVTIVESGYAYSQGDVLTVNNALISSADGTFGEVKTLSVENSGFNYLDGTVYDTFYTSAVGDGTGLTVTVSTDPIGKVLSLYALVGGQGYVTGPATITTSGSGTNLNLEIVASEDGLTESVSLVSGGSGYGTGTNAGTTSITGSGTGLLVNYLSLSGGVVSSLSVVSGGSGYIDGQVNFTGSNAGTNLLATIVASSLDSLGTFTLTNSGSGYVDGTYPLIPSNEEAGIEATIAITVDGNGSILTAVIDSSGTSFASGDVYYIDSTDGLAAPGDPGFNATITVSTVNPGGDIISIVVDSGGTDYVVGEILNVSGGNNDATVEVTGVSGGEIYDVIVGSNKGTGYAVGDQLLISGGNNDASIEVSTISGGQITSVSIVEPNQSSGFDVNEVIQFSGGRLTAEISVQTVTSGQVTGVVVSSSGQNYSIGDQLTISGGSGSAFITVTDTFDGSGFTLTVDSVDVTNSISFDVDNGNVSLSGVTSDTINSTDANLSTLDVDTVTNSVSITTPSILSLGNLDFTVAGDINIDSTNFNIGSTTSVEHSTGNARFDGTVNVGELIVDSDVNINSNTISTSLNTDLLLQPDNNKLTKVNTTSAFVVPVGTTDQRPLSNAETGAIRFNTDTDQYEGYNLDTNLWASLGGVRDSDGNTYIIPEQFSGANDNILYFYNNDANTLQLSESTLSFYAATTITSDSGALNVSGTTISFDNNLKLSSNTISTENTSITIKPSIGSNVVIDAKTSLAVPVGLTSERGNSVAGGIRYNTTNSQFEGYNGAQWTSLGGVRDVDGNTYITPEEFPGANDNTLYFVTDDFNALNLSSSRLQFTDTNTITSANIFGIPKWEENQEYVISDQVYYLENVYTASTSFVEDTTPPTHISGTVDNWTFTRKIYGSLTFEKITSVNVNSTLKVNDRLQIVDSTISSLVDDIVISPLATKKLVISGTTSIVVPVGTSSNRGTAASGSIRYNTENSQFEGYSGAAWTSLGGVRDVDGNTFIVPELTVGANDNTLWFFNNNVNTIKVTPTELVLENIETITTTNDILDLNSGLVKFNTDRLSVNTSTTDTKIISSQNNLDLGVSNDNLLRLTGSGDIQVNTTFGSTEDGFLKVFNKDLTYFGLQHTTLLTSRQEIIKGVNNTASYNLFDTTLAFGCKLTIICVNNTTFDKHMVDYNVVAKNGDLFNIEYEGLYTNDVLYDATFDITAEGEARVNVTLDSGVSDGDSLEFTFITTSINT